MKNTSTPTKAPTTISTANPNGDDKTPAGFLPVNDGTRECYNVEPTIPNHNMDNTLAPTMAPTAISTANPTTMVSTSIPTTAISPNVTQLNAVNQQSQR